MNETTTIGLDIAKQVFQVHGVAVDSTVTVKRQLRRSDIIRFSIDFRAAVWVLKPVVGRTSGPANSPRSATT